VENGVEDEIDTITTPAKVPLLGDKDGRLHRSMMKYFLVEMALLMFPLETNALTTVIPIMSNTIRSPDLQETDSSVGLIPSKE
jgi:hypothetical protein